MVIRCVRKSRLNPLKRPWVKVQLHLNVKRLQPIGQHVMGSKVKLILICPKVTETLSTSECSHNKVVDSEKAKESIDGETEKKKK